MQMSEMNRRNGSMLKVFIFVVVFLSCIYFIYLDHDVRTRLHETEKTAHRYRRESEGLSSQINDLQATHNDLKERSHKEKSDCAQKISDCTDKHSSLKSQHDNILGEYSMIKQQYDKLQEDQKQIESQRVSEYMKFKQEKELEISNLKDELANTKRDKDLLDNNVVELQKNLHEAQSQTQQIGGVVSKLEHEKATLQNSLQQLLNQQQQQQPQQQQNVQQNAQNLQHVGMQGGQLDGGQQVKQQPQQQQGLNQGFVVNNNDVGNIDQFKNINQLLEQNKDIPKDQHIDNQAAAVNPVNPANLLDVNDNSKFQIQPAKDAMLDGAEQGAGQKPEDSNIQIDESLKKKHEEDQQPRKQVLPPDINAAEEKVKEQAEEIKKEEEAKQGESFGINIPDEQNRQVVKPVLHEDEKQLPQPGPLKFDNAEEQQPIPFHRNVIGQQNGDKPGVDIMHQEDRGNVMEAPFGKPARHPGGHKDPADRSEIYEEQEDNGTYDDNHDDDGYNNYEDERHAGVHFKP